MRLVEVAVIGWAALAAGFSLVALWRLRGHRVAPHPHAWPKVLLLRPMDAPSEAELEALATPVSYPGELEHVALCPWPPPLPRSVRWLPSDPVTQNRKVGHVLFGVWALGVQDRVVVAIDADVRVDGALLEALVAPVAAGADLAWAAPRPSGARSLAGRAVRGLIGRGHHAFESLQAVAAGAPTVCGKALALGPRALSILPELTDCIGEDLELGLRLAAQGGRIEAAAAQAVMVADRGAGAAVIDRFTRWMQVLRAHRPGLYPLIPALFAPTLVLLLAAALIGSTATSLAVACLVAVRVLLSVRLAQRAGAGLTGAGWEWLLGEALLLVSFFRSIGRRTVGWRGRRFRLDRGGRMHELFAPVSPGAAS